MRRTVGHRVSEIISAAPAENRAGSVGDTWSAGAGYHGKSFGPHAHGAVRKETHSKQVHSACTFRKGISLPPPTEDGRWFPRCYIPPGIHLLSPFIDTWDRTLSPGACPANGWEAECRRYC